LKFDFFREDHFWADQTEIVVKNIPQKIVLFLRF